MEIVLHKRLKQLLKEHEMTAVQLSRTTGIPPQTINNWLSGAMPRNIDQLYQVATFFKLSIEQLMFKKEH